MDKIWGFFFEIINIKIIFLFKQKNPDLSFLKNTNKPLTPKANCKRRFKTIKKLPFIKLYNMVNLSKTIINNWLLRLICILHADLEGLFWIKIILLLGQEKAFKTPSIFFLAQAHLISYIHSNKKNYFNLTDAISWQAHVQISAYIIL